MNKYIILLVAFGVLAWIMSSLLGTGIFALTTILWVVLILAVIQKLGVLRLFPINAKYVTYLAALAAVVLFFTGGFAIITPMLSPAAFTGVAPGIIAPIPPTPEAVSTCEASVSDEIRGTGATLTFAPYDQAANSPRSAAVDVKVYTVDADGNIVEIKNLQSTAFSVGDVVSIVGGNSTYYVVPKNNICIDKQKFVVELDAYAAATHANLQITGYDDTGGTALSGGTNTTIEDYDITIGADGADTYYLKVKVNVANKAANIYAVGIAVANDIDVSEPLDSEWIPHVTPKFLKGLNLGCDDTDCTSNLTDVNFATWVLPAPIMLTEWQSKKWQFSFEASSTDPTTSTDFGSSDVAIVCFHDAVTDVNSGAPVTSFYTVDDAQSDVGIAVAAGIVMPVGKAGCTVIEGI